MLSSGRLIDDAAVTGIPIFDQAEAPRQLGSSITPRVAKVHAIAVVLGVVLRSEAGGLVVARHVDSAPKLCVHGRLT